MCLLTLVTQMITWQNVLNYFLLIVHVQEIYVSINFSHPTAGKGLVAISKSLILYNVLHVPNLSYNLLSISKLTHYLGNCAVYFPNHCEFQEMDSGKTIGNARESDGLYLFWRWKFYMSTSLSNQFMVSFQ